MDPFCAIRGFPDRELECLYAYVDRFHQLGETLIEPLRIRKTVVAEQNMTGVATGMALQ